MSKLLRIVLVAGVVAATSGITSSYATGHEQCLDFGPSQPFLGGPVPISRPTYVDPDPGACLRALIPGGS